MESGSNIGIWHASKYPLLREIEKTLAADHPFLRIKWRASELYVVGTFQLEEGGVVIDRFQVEIWVPPEFPERTPRVWETGGRLPRTVDYYFFPETGNACLFYPDERHRYWPDDSFGTFLSRPVREFFISQVHFRKHKQWPWGARSHGAPGILEYYEEEFGFSDPKGLRVCLDYLAREKLRQRLQCPCGSGRPIRSCTSHKRKFEELRSKIPRDRILRSAEEVDKYFELLRRRG